MPDRLLGINEKIERAKKHVLDLEGEMRTFRDGQPFRVFTEERPEVGKKLYRVRVTQQPPARWATFIGDAIHNLRTTLDHLAWQLVEAGGGVPGEWTYFPIFKDAKVMESTLEARMKGIRPEAIEVARRLKPYPGGNDLLWRLHRLDIYDKHRLLLVVGAGYRDLGLKLKLELPGKGRTVEFPTINIKTADRQFPVEDDAVLFTVPLDDKTEYEFTFEIAFSDGEVVQGEPVRDTLRPMVDLVEKIIDSFRSFLT